MTVTSTVGASGRNYSTIAAWVASLPSTLGDAYVALLYADAEFVNDDLVLSGHTTSATNTITVTAAPGQSFADNPANALAYDPSKGVAIRSTNTYFSPVSGGDQNVILSRLQIRLDNSQGRAINYSGGALTLAGNVIVGNAGGDQCIALSSGGPACRIVNNVIQVRGSGAAIYTVNTGLVIESNTIVRCSDVAGSAQAVSVAYNSPASVRDNAVFGFSSLISGGTFGGSAGNVTDLASPPSGFTQVAYSGQFVGNTSAAPNFRLASGSALINAGVVSSVSTDIFGTARPQGSAYDAGAQEAVSAAPAAAGYFFRGAQA